MAKFESKEVPLDVLLLDPNNYRYQDEPDFVFADKSRFHEEGVQARAYRRLRDEGLIELKNSILTNGFLPVERLVVEPYLGEAGLFLVREGNRRLAALRWIAEDHEAGVEVPDRVLESLNAVPVVVASDPADPAFVPALLGVRHVSGIRQWGGYQRAKIVAELKDDHGLDTATVADRLGMTPHEVNRRYRAFKALAQMQESEDYGGYARPALYPVFHEAVSLPAVRDWLGWDESASAFTSDSELEQFYALLSPTDPEDGAQRKAKISTREEARELRTVLPNEEARRVLFDATRGFMDAVAVAKRDEVSHAWRSQVAAAIDALTSIGIGDVRNLTEADRDQIEKLKTECESVLDSHRKLTS
jgi:hypothetical protein